MIFRRSNFRVSKAGDESECTAFHGELKLGVIVENIVCSKLVEVSEKIESVMSLDVMKSVGEYLQ